MTNLETRLWFHTDPVLSERDIYCALNIVSLHPNQILYQLQRKRLLFKDYDTIYAIMVEYVNNAEEKTDT